MDQPSPGSGFGAAGPPSRDPRFGSAGSPRVQAIVGSYVLVERLGAGGVGEVWKARDRLLNRVVALKFIAAPRHGASPLTDLLREARAASALNHPNIITIFEVGEREGSTYLAMEFVEGETLRDRMLRGAVPLDEAVDISSQIVAGLASAHAHGIIHRDLKPENIMLRIDGYVKLLDFGLAKVLAFDDATTGQVIAASSSGQLAGTFTYMSPEQARSRPVTTATDVFSLGIVLYELLTGEHPFRGETVLDTLNAIVSKEPPSVHDKSPAVPRALGEIVDKSLRKDPTARYASAVDLKEPLKQLRALPSMSAVLPPGASTRRRSLRWPLAAAVLLLLLLVGGWFVWHGAAVRSSAVGPVHSVAIMTFRTDPNDQAAAGAADVLSEDLGAALSAVGLSVLSRNTVMELGATAGGSMADLGVNALVEGTIRSADGRFRIHIEVVSARTRFQMWSGTFTPSTEDLMGGGQVPTDIARQLRAGVAGR